MDNVDSLALGRIVIGAASWAAPTTSFRLFRLHDGSQHHPYLARMFGAREIALGAATLIAQGEHKSTLVKLGVAVDTADAAAGVIALRSKAVSPVLGVLLTGMAVAAVASGASSLGRKG
jgi:hypothetical protein